MMRAHVHPPGWRRALSQLQERFRLSEMAGRKARISRAVDALALKRFSALCDCSEAIRVRLQFRFDGQGLLLMDGELAAGVTVACHRCSEPVRIGLESDFSVVIAASEAEATRLSAAHDVLCVDGDEAGIVELVEDELILALPERPCSKADCPQAPPTLTPAPSAEVEPEVMKPFAALGAWKPLAHRSPARR